MSGKVKCTCGWSWNKSDSSVKDMYICHECGRDNSNNIPKAQDGIQKMSSKDKRGIELLIKETENAKKDKRELQTTGQIKNPKSIAYKSKVKKQPELKQDNRSDYEREYDEEKGQAEEDKKQFKKNVIAPLDVATDIMQLGNFIPNPIAQTIGGIGNVAGMGIDAYQAYDDLSEGNYADAAINAGSIFLPMGLDSKTFRRNSKYLKPGQPLYPLSPQANLPSNAINIPRVNYIEPFTKVKGMTDTSLLANRALLGALGAETYMDIPKQKNGGWLDNYNDYNVSAPEGTEGDGFSNVGRNSSPAWGGQFQNGGKSPKYVESKNDPRYKAYQDSLKLYKSTPIEVAKLQNIQNKVLEEMSDKYSTTLKSKLVKVGNIPFNNYKNNSNYEGNNRMILGHNSNIKPLSFDKYSMRKINSSGVFDKWDGHNIQTDNFGVYKKPQQQVIVQRPNVQAIQNNLHPEGLVYSDLDIEAELPEIRTGVKHPKSWKYNKIEGGSEESGYINSPEDFEHYIKLKNLYEDKEHKDWLGTKNKIDITPQYQMGGVMPGAVGHMYARTGSPSKGPRRNQTDVTDASAQNGKEMQYYQQGLDFKPKSISQNGGWLDKYDVAQDGDFLDKFRESHPSVRSMRNDAMNRKIQESKGKGKEVNTIKKDNTRTITPKEIKKLSGKEQNELAQRQSEEQARKEQVFENMQEAYKSPLMSPGYFTPEGAAIGALQGTTKMGPDLYEGNYKGAVMDALMMLPIAIPAAKTLKNIKTSVAPELREGLQTSGFSDIFKSKPKSEINWGNWNKEIPENSQLMKEYNAIEQTTKTNGSWMKNPDGSAFQGTPEQFVQQNSENFKKAFGNTKVRDPKGNVQITNHSTWDEFDEFDLNKFGQTDDGFYGKGAYFHPNTNSPKLYGDIDMNSYVNIENPMPHDNHFFFGREGRGGYWDSAKNKQVIIDDVSSLWKNKYDGYITNHANYPLNDFNSTEYITNIPSNIKSATGNNGMFDMTNPNIYKALVPGAIGLGALQQQKDGGIIKDDRGQWDHPGEITEINSNDITMEGVPYDVLGISDTGDTKLMKPGKNYKFKGKKVTEYPMAKNGVNQQDQKTLQQLDQLTNFTNYNKPQPGGWLNKYKS